jgi:glutamine synthetase
MNSENFMNALKKYCICFVDFRFSDLKGVWHHMTLSAAIVDKGLLEEGIGFDGSSVTGWCAVHQSDLFLKPDLSASTKPDGTLMQDPFCEHNTAIVVCDVLNPATGHSFGRDPRSVAHRAEAALRCSGIADQAFFGPEPEFFLFDRVRYGRNTHEAFYALEADALAQQENEEHGCRVLPKGGYMPVMPLDADHNIRADMLTTLASMGVPVEKHHHEVAPCQHELGIRSGTLVQTADRIQMLKYVVRNVARRHERIATFMPKPVVADNGSGMHVHQSLWRAGEPLFAGNKPWGLSETALHYIGGILKHAPALNAFTNPVTNSYKRLVPGFEAPVILAWSGGNRSASCRIPLATTPRGRRVEVRFPDPCANPWLALSALLMAGLDGIINRIDPGDPHDTDLFASHDQARSLPRVSSSLRASLEALETSHDWLLRDGVFTTDLIQTWIDIKAKEIDEVEHHPHPVEFEHSFNL